jgi:hypothetical protein
MWCGASSRLEVTVEVGSLFVETVGRGSWVVGRGSWIVDRGWPRRLCTSERHGVASDRLEVQVKQGLR